MCVASGFSLKVKHADMVRSINPSRGAPMPRALALWFLLCASPAFGQSIYVGAAAGSDTFLTTKIEAGQFTPPESGGTTPVFAGRAGIALGERWGAEVEVAHSLTIERNETVDFPGVPVTLGGILPVGFPRPSFSIESEQALTAVNTLAWVSYPVNTRLDLVVVAGASFQRNESEQRFAVDFSRALFPTAILTIQPSSTRAITYDVGPVVGVEGRIRFGDHLRVVPALRLSDTPGGWSVRPTAGVDWVF
jgi:hypothetical protein